MVNRLIAYIMVLVCTMFLVSCGGGGGGRSPKFRSYYGPPVTWVVVQKQERRLYLFNNNKILKEYPISLGFAPDGHKLYEGDGRTPEGTYYIDRRNPDSDFHLSVGISYPNQQDLAFAQYMGIKPGGEIFIHGEPNRRARKDGDWTAGCIAVTNEAIEEIYSMVQDGTPITINP